MTDRELLELAAKSVGMKVGIKADEWFYSEWGDSSGMFLTGALHQRWNPLRDDGDALRLAVKLRLLVSCGRDSVDCHWYDGNGYFAGNAMEAIGSLRNGDDLHAATRRAIVRAAAKIGKGME